MNIKLVSYNLNSNKLLYVCIPSGRHKNMSLRSVNRTAELKMMLGYDAYNYLGFHVVVIVFALEFSDCDFEGESLRMGTNITDFLCSIEGFTQ